MSAQQNFTYVEDADEDTGSVLEGSKRYAASVAASPTKEKSNTSKSRREKPTRRSDSSSPHTNGQTDSDSTVHPAISTKREKEVRIRSKETEKERSKQKEKEKAYREKIYREKERKDREREQREREKERSATKSSMRPTPKHSKTNPVVHSQSGYKRPTVDNPEYYGQVVSLPAQQSHSRPRAMTTRPASYYSRPPSANAHFYASQPQTPYTPTSYPPQSWAAAGTVSYPVQTAALQSHPDYFAAQPYNPAPPNQHLLQRFQRERPTSALGFRSTSSSSYEFDDYDQENDASIPRRASLTKKHAEDRRRMPPPPPRPQSAAPPRQALRPPPPQQLPKRTSAYDDDDFAGEAPYREVVPRASSHGYQTAMLPTRPRRGSVSYDLPAYHVEPASTMTGRRHSYYGSVGASSYEDKYQAAAAYQDGVNGAPLLPLTKDALRKASKRSGGASSRSTRSSESRDESDYRHSATTQTTRSSNGDEDITIKVTGQAVLKVAGAEIQCQDGGEINIARQGSGRIGGSDKGSSIFGDRTSRIDRLPTRTRASSQAGSWSRSQLLSDPYTRGTFL